MTTNTKALWQLWLTAMRENDIDTLEAVERLMARQVKREV